MIELKLKEKLTDKEVKKFKIPNTLTLNNFNGIQYAMCIGAIYRNNSGNLTYNPDFSKAYIDTDITPNKLVSFCELHKDIILKEKHYINSHFTTIYYILYSREEKPMLINSFNSYNCNLADVEITFNDNGFYRIEELHLELSPNTSVIGAINSLFSNENIDGLPFISYDTESKYYSIKYYDEYGEEVEYKYNLLSSIYNCIINIRLVGCKEKEMK